MANSQSEPSGRRVRGGRWPIGEAGGAGPANGSGAAAPAGRGEEGAVPLPLKRIRPGPRERAQGRGWARAQQPGLVRPSVRARAEAGDPRGLGPARAAVPEVVAKPSAGALGAVASRGPPRGAGALSGMNNRAADGPGSTAG